MTESVAAIRQRVDDMVDTLQRVDDMIDTLRCQRDAVETRAETYYCAYTKALHRVEAAEAKLAAIRTWRQRYVDYGNEDPWVVELGAIVDGSGT